MSSGEKVRLGDVAKVNPKASRNVDDGDLVSFLPLASVNTDGTTETGEIKERGEVKKGHPYFMRGDILVAKITPSFENGKIAITSCETEDGYSSTEFHVVRPDTSRVDPNYLLAYLRSGRVRLFCSKRMKGSAGQRRVPKEVLSGLTLGLPPINIQRERAAKFNKISSMIAAHNEQIAQLDQLVKSRFVEMFGDPIVNPKKWDTLTLKELGELKNGVNFKSIDGGFEIKCLGVADFKDRYAINDMALINKVSLNGEPNESQLLKDGDIVFVRSNGNKALVGRCVSVFPGAEKVTFSGFCIRFRNQSDELNLDYLLNCLKSDSMRKAMAGRGANIQNLSQALLSKLEIPMPPLPLQQDFAAFAAQVDKTRAIAQQQIYKLQTLYDSLAQDYFS